MTKFTTRIYEAVMFKPWMYHYSKLQHLFVFGLTSAARRKRGVYMEEYYHINNEDSCTRVNISDNKQFLYKLLIYTYDSSAKKSWSNSSTRGSLHRLLCHSLFPCTIASATS